MNEASQDSDEGAHATANVTGAGASPMEPINSGRGERVRARTEMGSGNDEDQEANQQRVAIEQQANGAGANRKEPVISGHHNKQQRRLYLIILALSVFSALTGLLLILIWMLHYRPVTGFGLSDKAGLANLHPVLMYTFMVSVNMYAILIYRTHYCLAKSRLKWAHAILSGTNIVMSLLGVAAMYKAHLLAGIANFYSLHSWLGALTNGFYLAQFVGGVVAFLRPGWSQQQRARLMPWHRLAGGALLVLAAAAALTGIAELVIFQDKDGLYAGFTAITFIANLTGLSVIIMTGAAVYLLSAAEFRRPALPEEQPLKR